jgi:hypothetical protein
MIHSLYWSFYMPYFPLTWCSSLFKVTSSIYSLHGIKQKREYLLPFKRKELKISCMVFSWSTLSSPSSTTMVDAATTAGVAIVAAADSQRRRKKTDATRTLLGNILSSNCSRNDSKKWHHRHRHLHRFVTVVHFKQCSYSIIVTSIIIIQ